MRPTIATIRRRYRSTFGFTEWTVAAPGEDGTPVAVGPDPSWQGPCLTHLVRYTLCRPDGRQNYHYQCGAFNYRGRVMPVDPADELFACARCIEAALKHGEPTFNLVPTTGCEMTEGRRFRPRARGEGS